MAQTPSIPSAPPPTAETHIHPLCRCCVLKAAHILRAHPLRHMPAPRNQRQRQDATSGLNAFGTSTYRKAPWRASNKGSTRGQQGVNKGPTRGQPGVNKGSTRGQQGVNKGSTRGQQGVNKGSTRGPKPHIRGMGSSVCRKHRWLLHRQANNPPSHLRSSTRLGAACSPQGRGAVGWRPPPGCRRGPACAAPGA
jgi:hypothetical protein